ncbi:MAG: alanine--glyoxylate aminotransferase family protein [Gemmatimonadetes bacterium]|nr:alanine--glyoxylate aminotransferase family protein [Gemmatimonadota bacterium]MBT5057455.1 alanine--glyoxylate aminotransferase family protein [Gemmatimonadota bacterium]MBT5143600.1 alanine--glyoxylate aminotransferase family protein [Gemmatimonadota bacterium]MBT5588914.1 alanine--glyoxylate aminotransferase family protein [Gemmatimonadota bacterium]MBT5961384.1 alanine--glyoxylate aminotransferase family protein [Gemmatimonadota bacterium]
MDNVRILQASLFTEQNPLFSTRRTVSPIDHSIKRPTPPPLMTVLPAEPMLLMTAGPVPVPAEVARAGSMVIDHLGDTMGMVLRHIREMSRYVFQTQDDKIYGVSGPASAAMEMAIGNLLWPGRKALVLQGGLFSGRFAEMALGVGAEVTVLESEAGKPVTAQMVADQLKVDSYDVVTMVQGETSSGVLTSDLQQILKLARDDGAMTIVDAVCTLSTMPLKKDEWGIDVLLTGSQKGLSSLPGVSLISFSDRAWETAVDRQGRRPHWCLDVVRAERFWGEGSYHYTAPVPGLLAMHEALRLIIEETLEKRFERHLHSSLALQAGIEAMGLELFTPEAYRLNSVLAVKIPASVDDGRVRKYMEHRFKVLIAGAYGFDIVRIGQMGEQCRVPNLFRTLHALGAAVARQDASVDPSLGMATMEAYLAKQADDVL